MNTLHPNETLTLDNLNLINLSPEKIKFLNYLEKEINYLKNHF